MGPIRGAIADLISRYRNVADEASEELKDSNAQLRRALEKLKAETRLRIRLARYAEEQHARADALEAALRDLAEPADVQGTEPQAGNELHERTMGLAEGMNLVADMAREHLERINDEFT